METKPCPFCGAKMERVNWHKTLLSGHTDDCYLKGKPLFTDTIEAWNRRAGRIVSMQIIPWEPGQLGVAFKYDNGQQSMQWVDHLPECVAALNPKPEVSR
jgi:hypothetical protein